MATTGQPVTLSIRFGLIDLCYGTGCYIHKVQCNLPRYILVPGGDRASLTPRSAERVAREEALSISHQISS